MVQVTMTGAEYAELLNKEQKLQDLMEYFKTQSTVKFEDGSSYVTTETAILPQWFKDFKVSNAIASILALSDEDLIKWIRSGEHYYDPEANAFSTYSYGDERVNLLNNHAIRMQWNRAQAIIQTEAEEEAKAAQEDDEHAD